MSNYKYHFNSINGTQEITISDGNKKYKGNGTTEFMIFNLPAETTCPFASEDCKNFCYAKKSERIYKAVRACRERNYMATLEPEFVPAMVNLICDTLKRNKYVNAKHIVIRIHEAGDFYSPEYFAAWDRIAGYFEGDTRITFIAYTKSVPYIYNGYSANMVISSSIDNSTRPELIQMTAEKNMKIYKAVPELSGDPAAKICRCEDCGTCFICMTAKFMLTECKIH